MTIPLRDESEIRADERRRIVEALRKRTNGVRGPDGWYAAADLIERMAPDLIDCPTCGARGIGQITGRGDAGGIVGRPCSDCKDGKLPREPDTMVCPECMGRGGSTDDSFASTDPEFNWDRCERCNGKKVVPREYVAVDAVREEIEKLRQTVPRHQHPGDLLDALCTALGINL